MGGCDFSMRGYTYVDTEGDTTLSTFQLQEEDIDMKVRAWCRHSHRDIWAGVLAMIDMKVHPQ